MRISILLLMTTFIFAGCVDPSVHPSAKPQPKPTNPVPHEAVIHQTVHETQALKNKTLNMMFTISADTGTLDRNCSGLMKITLKYPTKTYNTSWKTLNPKSVQPATFNMFQHTPVVHAFSDRPISLGTRMSIAKFILFWQKADSFGEDPPFANLVYWTKKDTKMVPTTLTVGLGKPSIRAAKGEVSFLAWPVNQNNSVVQDILDKNQTIQMLNPSVYIDNWFTHAIHTVGNAIDHATHAITAGADNLVNQAVGGLDHLADTIKSDIKHDNAELGHLVDAAKDFVTSQADDLKTIAEDAENGIVKVADEVKDGVVALIDAEKCLLITIGFILTDGAIGAVEAAATGGAEEVEWELVAAALEAAAKSGAAEAAAKGAEEAAKKAGASEDVAGCIGDATDILAGQALEMGSFSAFLLDIFKQVILEKAKCANLFDDCFFHPEEEKEKEEEEEKDKDGDSGSGGGDTTGGDHGSGGGTSTGSGGTSTGSGGTSTGGGSGSGVTPLPHGPSGGTTHTPVHPNPSFNFCPELTSAVKH